MKLLTSKAGVTVLEGVIALGLLAVVTAGAFGVLLSAARKSTQPDMREEMVLAVEQAKDKLQVYINTALSENPIANAKLPEGLAQGLCGPGISDTTPLSVGNHNIKCLLPRICDEDHSDSHFTYTVGALSDFSHPVSANDLENGLVPQTRTITFDIACNGYEL